LLLHSKVTKYIVWADDTVFKKAQLCEYNNNNNNNNSLSCNRLIAPSTASSLERVT